MIKRGMSGRLSWMFLVAIMAVCFCSFVLLSVQSPLTQKISSKQELGTRLELRKINRESELNQPEFCGKVLAHLKEFKKILSNSSKINKEEQVNPPVTVPANIMEALKHPVFLNVHDLNKYFQPSKILRLGHTRKTPGYLVIGIPTVHRTKAYYLMDTLKLLVQNLSEEEKKEVIIVIFVADFDEGFRRKVVDDVKNKHASEIKSGLIQVIVAPKEYYPNLDSLIPLHGDKHERVKWRSKQSLDYSFLYFYCSGLSKYYVQLEDDVLTVSNYLSQMKRFISKKGGNWSNLEFGARGFIGMTYHSKHLKSLSRFCRMFFWVMPIDWLFRIYNDIYLYGNVQSNVLKPPLFKHIGEYSSLNGQVRKLEDLVYVKHIHQPKKGNPAANISTSMTVFVEPHSIENPYGKEGRFWAKEIHVDDFVEIMFDKPQQVERIIISSGSPAHPSDALEDSDLRVTSDFNNMKCENYTSVLKSKNSIMIDYHSKKPMDIKCIKLVIKSVRLDEHMRKRWLLITEIAILTKS